MKMRVVSFHYKLTDKDGKVLDSSEGHEPLSYMEGTGQIIPGLEKQLTDLKKGDKKKVVVPAKEAYGLWDDKKIITVTPDKLPTKDVKVGDRFSGGDDDHAPVFVVTKISPTAVTLDGNHPLAGMDLTFDVEMTDMREATAEEVSHGHAHGEHGHSH